jgi:hypothetical protein
LDVDHEIEEGTVLYMDYEPYSEVKSIKISQARNDLYTIELDSKRLCIAPRSIYSIGMTENDYKSTKL